MPHFAAGVIRFQNDVFPEKKDLFEKLSLGQSPRNPVHHLLGLRLFICHHADYIVPPRAERRGGISAFLQTCGVDAESPS